jgi:hypothetical protein
MCASDSGVESSYAVRDRNTVRISTWAVTWNSAFKQNSWTFLAHSSTFRRWVLSRGDTRGDAWWRKLERLTQSAQ